MSIKWVWKSGKGLGMHQREIVANLGALWLSLCSLLLSDLYFPFHLFLILCLWINSIALSLSLLILSSISSSVMLSSSIELFSAVIVFFTSCFLFDTFLYFLFLCWNSHFIDVSLSWLQWTSLWWLLWTLC